MVNDTPIIDTETDDSTLADLIDAGDDLVTAVPSGALAAAGTEPLSLDLGDLLPDEAGEVVLMGGVEVPMSIHAGEAVTAMGIADAHVTAGGLDVTGLHFYSFENGVTLYSLTDLVIDGPHSGG